MPILWEYLDAYCHVKSCSIYKRSCIISQEHFQWGFLILEITELNNDGFLYYFPL